MGHLVFGALAILLGLSGVFIWWEDFGRIVRGGVPLALVVLGLVAIAAGLGARRRRHEPKAELTPGELRFDQVFRSATTRLERQPLP